MKILDTFPHVKEARHGICNVDVCLKGTREGVLDIIKCWAMDFNQPSIYWLNGIAGTGKSTIARTIAESMHEAGNLGASFFCSRDPENKDLSNPKMILPTLAVQLAEKYPSFRSNLIQAIKQDQNIAHKPLDSQMNKLIVTPLQHTGVPNTVIVIDALDQFEGINGSISEILSVLGEFTSKIPNIKFLITSRPEQQIHQEFLHMAKLGCTMMFALHEVESSQVNNDIRKFFMDKLLELESFWWLDEEPSKDLEGWPTEEQLDKLCEHAAGWFFYAAAMVKFIGCGHQMPSKKLDLILQSPESSILKQTTLHSFYVSILQEAFCGPKPEEHYQVTRSVLGAVVHAPTPLSPSGIAMDLGLDVEHVHPCLESVQSVLILQGGDDGLIKPFHKSFVTFLTNSNLYTDKRFCVPPPT